MLDVGSKDLLALSRDSGPVQISFCRYGSNYILMTGQRHQAFALHALHALHARANDLSRCHNAMPTTASLSIQGHTQRLESSISGTRELRLWIQNLSGGVHASLDRVLDFPLLQFLATIA